MNTVLKIGLILGGGYVLMRYTGLKLPMGTQVTAPPAGGTDTPPAGGTDTPPPGTATTPPPPTATPAVIATPAVSEAVIKRAAGGDAEAVKLTDAFGIKLNADEWNWYREQETGQVTEADLFPPENRAAKMTASEYLQRRVTAGLGSIVYGRKLGWA